MYLAYCVGNNENKKLHNLGKVNIKTEICRSCAY